MNSISCAVIFAWFLRGSCVVPDHAKNLTRIYIYQQIAWLLAWSCVVIRIHYVKQCFAWFLHGLARLVGIKPLKGFIYLTYGAALNSTCRRAM